MTRVSLAALAFLLVAALPQSAQATRSAELYSSEAYGYGRVEARLRFAGGDGVIGSFFLWKDGSEQAGTFWNELDFEKVGADCHLESNPLYGNPAQVHSQKHTLAADLCGGFHTYTYEWTPDHIAWLVDGVEIRRETGETATAYATNATAGMKIHFNVWPGDASFGGNFKPEILPVHEYVDWVQFSSYKDGTFTSAWREDFDGATLPSGWLTGNWASPKNLSTHDAGNVNVQGGYVVLSITADDAVGPAGAMPGDSGGGAAGLGGSGAAGGPTSAGAGAGGTAASGAPAGGNSGSGGSGALGGNTAAQSGASAGGAAGALALNDPRGTSAGANGSDLTGTAGTGLAASRPSGSNGCGFANAHGQRPALPWLSVVALALLARARRKRSRSLASGSSQP
jgi:hypothetical protein